MLQTDWIRWAAEVYSEDSRATSASGAPVVDALMKSAATWMSSFSASEDFPARAANFPATFARASALMDPGSPMEAPKALNSLQLSAVVIGAEQPVRPSNTAAAAASMYIFKLSPTQIIRRAPNEPGPVYRR